MSTTETNITEVANRPAPELGGMVSVRPPVSMLAEIRRRPWRAVAVVLLLFLIGGGLSLAGLHLWATYHFRAGKEELRRHKVEKARKHLELALKIWPSSSETRFLAAQAARRAGAYEEAAGHLTRCQALDGGISGPIQLERTLLRAAAGDLHNVEEVLWEYLMKPPPDSEPAEKERYTKQAEMIWETLGVTYLAEFRPGMALRCFKDALEIDPDNLIALAGRAWVFERMSNLQEAESDLRRVVELNPEDDKAKIRLAAVLFLTSRAPDALKIFEEVLPRHRDDPSVIIGMARCQLELGRADEAGRVLDGFLDKDKGQGKGEHQDNAEALTERGKIALQAGQLSFAEGFLRRAVEIDPYSRQSNYMLYQCLSQQGKEKEAQEIRPKLQRIEADIERLMKITMQEMDPRPRDPELRYEVGAILLRNGKVEGGIYWLQKALELDQNYQPAHRLLFEHYRKTNNNALAERHRRLLQGPVSE